MIRLRLTPSSPRYSAEVRPEIPHLFVPVLDLPLPQLEEALNEQLAKSYQGCFVCRRLLVPKAYLPNVLDGS